MVASVARIAFALLCWCAYARTAPPSERLLDQYLREYLRDERSGYAQLFDEHDGEAGVQSDAPSEPLASATSWNGTQDGANTTHDIQKWRQRAKKDWLDVLKNNILQRIGRKNETHGLSPDILEQVRISLNKSVLPFTRPVDGDNRSSSIFEEYTEKIRSFYPSCGVPKNTDEELWNDDTTMNLFFTIDYNTQPSSEVLNVASATLRLYKLPQEGNATILENCQKNENALHDEDRQVRASVYWYARSLKKHKAVKRRLSDSKMVPLLDRQTTYVEFNIRPATRSWIRGRNLGLAVVVEDLDGSLLPAEKYFRGIGCTGALVRNGSTPKPIPSVIIDTIRSANGHRGVPGGADPDTGADSVLLPIVDVCTVELPAGRDAPPPAHTCRHQRRPTRPDQSVVDALASGRHIRHQRQQLAAPHDPRGRIVSKQLVISNQELAGLELAADVHR